MTTHADGDLLRELVTRRLGTQRPAMPGEAQHIALLPGALPDNLPVRLPIEGQDRLVGSVLYQVEGQAAGWDIVLDANRPVTEVVAAYERALTEQGWQVLAHPPMFMVSRGFTPAPPPSGGPAPTPAHPGEILDLSAVPAPMREEMSRHWAFRPEHRTYCAPGGAGSLALTVTPRPTAPADVQIRIDTGQWGPCAMEEQTDQGIAGRMPALTVPPGVALMPRGGGGSADEWTSLARAMTDQRAADLAAHFAAQLEAAGWVRQAAGAADPVAWSTWTIPGPPEGHGFLYVLEKPGTPRRDLYVELTASTDPAAGSGDWSFTRTHQRQTHFSWHQTGPAQQTSGGPEPPPEQS
jgi:hypothetical protein